MTVDSRCQDCIFKAKLFNLLKRGKVVSSKVTRAPLFASENLTIRNVCFSCIKASKMFSLIHLMTSRILMESWKHVSATSSSFNITITMKEKG